MAYQPKSYKKFVATAATATLVATAVVPAAFADEVKPAAFTDVAKQYEAAVNFVVANNIAKGLSETQFGVSAQIKRGDAAIMIANAAGLNDETAPASGFSDVPTRGVLAINSLKKAGVVNGKTATNFGFNDSITRGEAAIILANAFKLKGNTDSVKFTDVNARYQAAVAALVDAGVTNGISATQFGTGNNIKRGDFARFIYALEDYIVDVNPEAPVLNYDGQTSFSVEYGAAFTLPVVTATDDVDQTVEVKQVITNPAGNTVSAVNTEVPGTYTVTYSAVDSDGNKAKDLVITVVVAEEVVTTPAIKSVVAVDAATLQLNFNTALDKDTFNAAGNFNVTGPNGTTVTGAKLSEDGKTVTLTVSPVMVNDGQYTVTVDKDLQTSQGKDFAEVDFVRNILFSDEVKPTVSAVSTPNGNLRITLSEKIQEPSVSPIAVVINGQSITVTDGMVDGNVIEIPRGSLTGLELKSGTSYPIAVAGALDLAGNAMTLYSNNVTYQTITDTVAPTFAKATVIGETTATLTFSEELTAANASDLGLTVKQNGATVSGVTATTTDNVNYKLTFPTSIYDGNATSASLEITAVGYKDTGLNVGASSTKSISLNKDTVKPTFVRSTYNADNNTTTLTLSEDVTAVGTLKNNVRVINNANSQEVTTFGVNAVNNALELTGLANGSYTVYVNAGALKDVSIEGNTNAAFSTSINVSQSATAATVTSASANGDTLKVNFNTSVTGGTGATSAANIANYRLDGQALPAGTIITLGSSTIGGSTVASSEATITLPEGSIETTRTGIITVNNVAAQNGTTINNTNALVSLVDTRDPELTAAKIVNGELVLTFSENINPSFDFTDFDVKVNGVDVTEAVGTLADSATADNQLNIAVSGASLATGSVTVTVSDSAVAADVANNPLVKGTSVTATR